MFKRDKELIDNGTLYTKDEVEAIENVSNYICGYKYNMETIMNDIKLVSGCYDINSGHRLLKEFDKLFIKFLNKKHIECERFARVLLNPKENYLYQEVLECEKMPFRYSKNPLIDKCILDTIIGNKNYEYNTMINMLAPNHEELWDETYNYIVRYGISYEDFGKRAKMGWIEKYPNSDKEIYERFLIEQEKYLKEEKIDDTKAIGNYAELIFYKYLSKNREDNEKLMWVARFIGDGFGYDIMTYNSETKKVKLYEVKGSVSLGNSRNIELTEKETNMYRYALKNNIEYHAVKVFFDKDITKIYDLYFNGKTPILHKINDNDIKDIIVPNEEQIENAKTLTFKLA